MSNPIQTILVPLDFSTHSDRALDYAMRLADQLGVKKLVLVHAYHPPTLVTPMAGNMPPAGYAELEGSLREAAEKQMRERAAKLEAAGIEAPASVVTGIPADAICDVASQHGADLIVMGTRGATGLKHVLFGSVAERTITAAPCPVLAVKEDDAGS